MTTLNQVVQGASINAGDVNQLVQACTGLLLANPGPMVQIATQTITTTTASVAFANIPAYNNLYLTWQARSTNTSLGTGIQLRVNNDSSANYYTQAVSSSNTTTVSTSAQGATSMSIGQITAGNAAASAMTGGGNAVILHTPFPASYANVVSTSGYISSLTAGGMTVDLRLGSYQRVFNDYNSIILFPGAGSFAGSSGTPCIFTLYGSM